MLENVPIYTIYTVPVPIYSAYNPRIVLYCIDWSEFQFRFLLLLQMYFSFSLCSFQFSLSRLPKPATYFDRSYSLCMIPRKYCTLGWRDLALFAIFEKLHVSADQVYWKNRQISLRVRIARAAKFSFSGNLIMNIFV